MIPRVGGKGYFRLYGRRPRLDPPADSGGDGLRDVGYAVEAVGVIDDVSAAQDEIGSTLIRLPALLIRMSA